MNMNMRASLLTLVLAAPPATARSPLDGQRIELRHVDPCVRLLNATGTIGCATRSSGSLAPLHVLRSDADLAALLRAPPEGGLAVALAAPLFHLTTLRALTATLGAKLDGVLVLDARAMPAQVPSSPDLAVPLGTETQPRHPWNAAGTGFSHERFPFAIVLLGTAESAAVLVHAARAGASVGGSGRGNPPLVELRYPMSARGDAPSCLARETCLPLGGQSVWGSLEPRTAPDTVLLPLERPVVALTASLDATGFFHETAPGANAAVASLVAVLAAVDAVVSDPALASQLGSLPKTALFFLFTGEAWGELGSRRLLTDVRNFTCATPTPTPTPTPPPPPGAVLGNTPSGAPSQRPPQRPPLPAPSSCQAPFKRDLRFLELRERRLTALVHVGPIGAREAGEELFIHTSAAAMNGGTNGAAEALRSAASAAPVLSAPSLQVRHL